MTLTRKADTFPCRIEDCAMEDYVMGLFGMTIIDLGFEMKAESICLNCPMMKVANKLAEYEDKYERE